MHDDNDDDADGYHDEIFVKCSFGNNSVALPPRANLNLRWRQCMFGLNKTR